MVSHRIIFALIIQALVLTAPSASAQQTGEDLLRSKTCLGCHQVDAKRLGPSFALIAQRYGAVPNAEDYLAIVIRQGGRNRWGAVPMPAQPQVSEQEARVIAQWILTLPQAGPQQ